MGAHWWCSIPCPMTMEAGKARLKGDSIRSANEQEVKDLKEENARLKELVAEQALQLQVFKKSLR
jgi:transposase